MSILIKNIKKLVQVRDSSVRKVSGAEMKYLPFIENAFLFIEGDKISAFGKMSDLNPKSQIPNPKSQIDATGKLVFPSWCDSHTHLVFAGSREQEFVDRINGLTYEEIAKRGGGILNSAKKLQDASEEELIESALNRLNEIMLQGTGAVEIKSGYGLTVNDEIKMLRVIQKLKTLSPLTIKSTFLGAHSVPANTTKEKYIDIIINEMLPQIAEEKLADYCDVFCERNYFTKEDTVKMLSAASKLGLKGKVHAEQLSNSGGVKAGVECGAISVDHLEYVNDEDIAALKNSETMPTILPGAQWFLQLPFPPARKMIDAGLPLAVASDYNPGSSPSGNMNFMISVACVQYKMTPEEAINAATINSAYAMGLSEIHGSIAVGKQANVFITKEIPDYSSVPYFFANDLIEKIIIKGKIVATDSQII
ncbi:MAG TPA: imidazolonepropionase [Bacteroidia bacterium]|nr:imidazolonepropionase [Bacteroidia bacterium]